MGRRHRPAIGPVLEHWGLVNSVAFSPDGKTILTGSNDRTARLWDAATGRPIGHPLAIPTAVSSVAFSPDGKTILTGCLDGTARLWDTATGQPVGARDVASFREVAERCVQPGWSVPAHELTPVRRGCGMPRRRFPTTCCVSLRGSKPPPGRSWTSAARSGSSTRPTGSSVVVGWNSSAVRPRPDPAPRLDPILFGGNPAARGDAWKERGLWDKAEAAYAEAAHARPLNSSIRRALARYHLERGRLDRAAATLAEAVRLIPDDLELRLDLGRSLLWSGDQAGWRKSNAALLHRFGATANATTAKYVAWALVPAADATTDPEVAVRLAEAAFKGVSEYSKANRLNTLGAALYRAGRFDEAIHRLEEGIQFPGRDGRAARTGRSWRWLTIA